MSEDASTINVGGYHIHVVRMVVKLANLFWVYVVKGLQDLSETVFWFAAAQLERFVPEYKDDISKDDYPYDDPTMYALL